MSVGQLPPRRAPQAADDAKLVQYDKYIDTQIHATRRAVKAVDWATALVELAAGVIAFLLAAAAVEHWLVPGAFPVAVRTALFLCLIGTLCYFAYRRLWPLCRRAINPVYAAQTIERSSPTLKNSLINLLLFRQHREQISEAVFHTLEEQAAHGLARVPIEAAVDRSLLIRVGYVLLAVVTVAGLYKVLSPKDPLVAAERVLFPWSDIVPASRVTISSITPGTVTVARGEFVDVSAEIHGLDDNDPVLLRFTTADGQAVDQPIEMKLAKDGLRFEGRLPERTGGSDQLGLAQNAQYRIEAGDARTLDYAVTVVPAPSMLVQRVDYDYPDYTGFVDRQVEGLGDIRAIEGTRVTLHARANGAIKEAHVDFDADGRPNDKMTTEGTEARASFELALREDRQTPRHASYVLRFTNSDGRSNRDPVKHPIAVEPDLNPEAAILLPQEKLRDVRLGDTVTIEVEARDPDFALSAVRLRGEVAGRKVIDHELLASKHAGRFTARYQFKTSGQDLRAGDLVEYWVVAHDNRTPKSNEIESDRKQLRIASPKPVQQPPPDRIAQNDRPRQNQQQRQQQDKQNQQQNGDQQQNGGDSGAADGKESSREAQPSAEQRPGDKETGRDGEPASAGGKENPPQGNEPADDRSNKNQPGGQGQSGQQAKPGEQNSNGEQTGAGAAGGESSEQGSQPGGARPDGSQGARSASGQQQNSKPDTPVSAEGDNDAEAFDRIQEHLKREGELKEGESETADGKEGQPSAEQKQGDKEPGRQGGEPASAGGKNDAPEKSQNPNESQTSQSENASSQEQGDSARQQQPAGQASKEPGTRAPEQGAGQGAETRPDDLPDDSAQPKNGGEQPKSPGGQQTASKGPSGAGNEQQSQGAPNSQPEMKPTEKPQQSGSGEQADKEEPTAGARGKRESDSHGEEGGDKAGGGEEGGGQKSPRDGTGSAGQNQSADEGAGESAEKGAGNTSPNAGRDATANRRTGEPSGETPGRGSKQQPGEGQQPGGAEPKQGDNEAGGQGNESSREAQPSTEQSQGDKETGGQGAGDGKEQEKRNGETSSSDKPNDGEPASAGGKENGPENDPSHTGKENSDQRGGTPSGEGGQQGTDAAQSSSSQGEAPPADAANLEYARKQTDLVLDKLANQLSRKNVDKSLLDKLGWTEADLRRFVERWQQLKDSARRTDRAGEAATRDLDDALRSLGLRRGQLQQGTVRDDTHRDLRQGYRGPVPREYQDRLRAYNQGVSRARENGE